MALKSTIHKVRLTLANLNIHHYSDYNLTLAKHPSENDLRLMCRILAFALSAHEDIQFTKGISSDEEPDLWKVNYDGSIEHWIELGLLDERRIRQACARAQKVSLYTYHGNQALQWFENIKNKVSRFEHLKVVHLIISNEEELISFAGKSMDLNISIEDNEIWLSDEKGRILIAFVIAV